MKVFNLAALLFLSLCTGSASASAGAPAAPFPFSDGVQADQIHTVRESGEIEGNGTSGVCHSCVVTLAAMQKHSLLSENGQKVQTAFEREGGHNALPHVEMAGNSRSDNERVRELVTYFKTKDLDLESLLGDDRFELYDELSSRFINSAERKTPTLEEYKKILNFDAKKVAIREFMQSHHQSLKEAESKYGIPTYVISAIIGLESNFGSVIGRYNPLNVYVSMYSEDYRSQFARAQLEELLIFIRDRDIDVFELKSSYAGAMSYAQFIPYSLNRWFVGDDIFDMHNNIQSVANYLSHFKNITGTIEGAVYRYNPSSLYRDTVMALAEEAELHDKNR